MKKRSPEKPARKKIKIPIPPAVIAGCVAACLAGWYGWWMVNNADFFKVKHVITRGGDPVALMHIRGRNIFRVNLEREADILLKTYPDYQNVQMVRVLPNRIFVNLMKRRPVALLKLYRTFAIDDEGVLFQMRPEYEAMGLTVIAGLETRLFGPKAGKRYSLKELSSALEMITLVKKNPLLQPYAVSTVDVGDTGAASMILADARAAGKTIEVRMGIDRVAKNIDLLAGVLRQQSADDISRIAYVDLRFKEPVIKLKENQKKEGASSR